MAPATGPTLTRRGWTLSTGAWLLLCLLQAPPLTVADTKHDLVADPWGFLGRALSPWTDVFPLGQLQNQAYGYLFPHGLFFALLSWLPDWLTQRLWWTLLLTLAFAGAVKLLDAAGVGSRASRILAAVLFACSPRILTTLGAISSEAWPVALVPWILLPLVRLFTASSRTRPSGRQVASAACTSAVAVLCLGAVNAVATLAAVVPAVVWWVVAGACASDRTTRRTAWRFLACWVPAGLAACAWWIGPLLILGRYSPPFTDYIESAGVTTHWFTLGEVLRGATSWTPFLDGERRAGAALAGQAVFVAGTLTVSVLGLVGLTRAGRTGSTGSTPHAVRRPLPHRAAWLTMLTLGLLVFGVAGPFSPVHDAARSFLDGAGAPLRNLHKFDTLVHLPLLVGVAHLLAPVRPPTKSAWLHPEKHRPVVVCTVLGLLVAVVTAPVWSARLTPLDGYRGVPAHWTDAAAWLNDPAHGAAASRTMILPRAATARQDWGNTRDEPAQALLDVPWVVRDAVPLVPPEAIRGLDGVQREFDTGAPAPALAGALLQQGVGFLLVRSDLVASADTPGARGVLRTLRHSPGFTEEASFGDGQVRIFRIGDRTAGDGDAATTAPRTVHVRDLDVVAGGAEVLPRLAAADGTGTDRARDRVLLGDPGADDLATGTTPVTVTDTPALREHSYGTVTSPDSAVRAPSDPWRGLNPVRDYPSGGIDGPAMTHVRERGGRILASSAADDPTALGGADTLSPVSAAVDGDPATAWYPAPGSPVNQSLTVTLPESVHQLRLTARAQGTALRLQVTTSLAGRTVASSTVRVPVGRDATVSLPPGDADRVQLRIIGAWGRAGLSEFALTGTDGTDVTPRRDIVVPAPDTGAAPGRWVLGQEVPEATMRRTVTVPDLPGAGTADMRVRVSTADCTAVTSVDGDPVDCGDILTLDAGEHEVRSAARWVSLDVQGGVRGTDGTSPDDRIVVAPTAVSSGRVGRLDLDGRSVDLAPVTVNGWQQGWSVPASLVKDVPGLAGLSDADLATAVHVSFPATGVYRAWLAVGAGVGLLLLAVSLVLGSGTGRNRGEGRGAPAGPVGVVGVPGPEDGPDHPEPTSGHGTRTLLRVTRVTGAALTAATWAALSWILAGVPGILTAAATTVVLTALPRLSRLRHRPRHTAVGRPAARLTAATVVTVTGAVATVLCTRGPWGGGGLADGYAGASLPVQLLFVAALTAAVASGLPAPRPDRVPRAAHQRATARRDGSSTSA